MNSRFDLQTKGWISLAVILMFTVAFIAGQARANLHAEATPNSEFVHATEVSIALDTESLQKIEVLRHVVDTVFALPIDVELRINGLTLRTDGQDDAGAGDAPVQ